MGLMGFLRDESGSATVWAIFWTVIFLLLAGITIDASNAYRFRSALQMTADASSHGALMSFLDENAYVDYTGDTLQQVSGYRGRSVAEALAAINMRVDRNGAVVTPSNIVFGRWNGSSFNPTGTPVNAAKVTAQRTASVGNELPTLILSKFGLLSSWDVGASSVTEAYFQNCPSQEGIMAGGGLQIASNNLFVGRLCLHGEHYVDLNNNNEFQTNTAGDIPGLSFGPEGAVCSGFDDCQTEGFTNVTVNNTNLTESMIDGPTLSMPDVPEMISDIELVLANPLAYAGESDGRNHYIPKNLVTNPDRATGEAATLATPLLPDLALLPAGVDSDDVQIVNGVVRIEMTADEFQFAVQNAAATPLPPNAIYTVNDGCASGNRRLELDDTVVVSDIVLMTSCRVLFSNDIQFVDSYLFTTYSGSNSAVHGSAGVVLGGGTCANAHGGSTIVSVNSNVDFAAGFAMNNSQIISGADVDIAAQPNGMEGTSILAANDVRVTSNGEWQGCPNASDANPVVAYSYKLVE